MSRARRTILSSDRRKTRALARPGRAERILRLGIHLWMRLGHLLSRSCLGRRLDASLDQWACFVRAHPQAAEKITGIKAAWLPETGDVHFGRPETGDAAA